VKPWRIPPTVPRVVESRKLSSWYARKMGLTSYRGAVRFLSRNAIARARTKLRDTISRALFGRRVPIVIASSGRSGSTMLFKAISEGLIRSRFSVSLDSFLGRVISRFTCAYVTRLSEISDSSAPILKTHDMLRDDYKDLAKYIFVFADPLDSAQSVEQMKERRGPIWVEEHIFHLGSQGTHLELFQRDVLGYADQVRAWLSDASPNILCIHYEEIWDQVAEISDFLGFSIRLPRRRPRQPKPAVQNYDRELFKHLRVRMTELLDRRRHLIEMKRSVS